MNAREEILGRIVDRPGDAVVTKDFSSFVAADLWVQFESQLVALGGRMIDAGELGDLSRGVVFAEAETGFSSSVDLVWDAEIGISVGSFAIAETGSVVVDSSPGRHRLSTLLPKVSVILVDEDQIVGSLAEGFARMPSRNAVIVSGTSRTADIEGVLVRGVHGPGELLVHRRQK